jgi:hypothetical protein
MIAVPRSSFLSLALIAVLLAACGAPREPARDAHMSWYDKYPDWKPGDPMPNEAAAAEPAAPKPAAPKPAVAAKPQPADASPPASTPPQRQAALPPAREPLGREPPPEPPKLEELRGLDAAQLMQLLGKPTLLRDEATAQMWQYRSEACVLHLFLYPNPGAAGEKRVQYVEARPRQTGAPAATSGPNECLATLVGARRLRS